MRVRDQDVEAELRCVPSQVVYSAGTVVCDRTGADDKLLAKGGRQIRRCTLRFEVWQFKQLWVVRFLLLFLFLGREFRV